MSLTDSQTPTSPPQGSEQGPEPEIDDASAVYRMIPVGSCEVIDGQWEFQSAAFDNASPLTFGGRDDEMSVILSDKLAALKRVPERLPLETPCAGDPESWGVARLNVGFLRSKEDQEVLRSPTDDERAHGDVRGKKGYKRRRRLKQHAEWVIRPEKDPSTSS